MATPFAEQLTQHYQGHAITMMIDIGRRLGLWDELGAGPTTIEELAARTELSARHLREWLGAVSVAGIVTHEGGVYTLPADHAFWLTGTRYTNIANMSGLFTGLGERIDDVCEAFRTGSGVGYDRYRPHFTHSMDVLGRARYDALLVSTYLPQSSTLVARLTAGATAYDVGCGTGHCLNIMAEAFPNSTFVGIDISTEAIALGEEEALAMGLKNVRFEVLDARQLPVGPCADVVFAFDAIHDQQDPAAVLGLLRGMLHEDGELFMVDIKASSSLDDNLAEPRLVLMYATSLLHCMEVGLVDGGAGLGAVWGTQLATQMLHAAGFNNVSVHEITNDPTNQVYVCRP
jgi:SAM-dependent methyltransferase